jgi:transcription-repair coupling factor (superfamily II helicase)
VKKSFDSEALFARVARALEGRLEKPRAFEAVAEAAQPFLAALIVRAHPRKRFWVDCPDVRAQENFAAELAAWCGGTRIFAEMDIPAAGEALPDPETAAERLEILRALGGKEFRGPLVIHRAQWDQDVPASEELSGALLRVEKGGTLGLAQAAETLAANGYERAAQVATRGQFAIRGGIFDVFSWQAPLPFRIELDDETIDSIRVFDPHTQISTEERDRAEILAGRIDRRLAPLRKYRRKEDVVLSVGTDDEAGDQGLLTSSSGEAVGDDVRSRRTSGLTLTEGGEDPGAEFFPQPFADFGAGDLVLDAVRRDRFFRQLDQWRVDGWMVVIAANSEGEIERFRELAEEHEFETGTLNFLKLPVARGFVFPAAKLAVLSDAELFGRSAVMRSRRLALRRERVLSGRAAVDFTEFEPGDYVVHLEHGVGRFIGLQKPPGTDDGEVLVLEYAGEARLYVPLDQAWQVARYVGLGKKHPDLSDLNDGRWQRAKQKVQQSIFDYASRMLKLQAERDTTPGHAFPPDTHWQQEFEDAFPYDETADQLRAIGETKADMESERPMDRLICGDVGFGKTEVAIRAIFKAVMGNRQAAMLAPTTVLAQQHYQTLRERMSDYPVRVELLSRYRTAAEQQKVLKGLVTGEVDIVVGTHRLVSPDVAFKDLGLVVVDEEQRFGVKHKELLKERFRQVDVLTLSATPIPRTLYMALMGARDMSVIDTPPANRQPVETIVCAYDERVFRDAIQRELARGGQVYFLHNRVSTIEGVAARIRELCPGARVVYGHGQMSENELEPVMRAFVAGEADVLVSTTIIESGLDIPNANTIIIDRADLFGLADLYQLRGRVGRAQAKAHAYLMLPRDLMGAARKRVSAIKQYSDLGSGFKIAMRDLEIRGAGNLLGTAQSGHIIAVGFDLYCKLLKHAVDTLKGVRRGARVPSGLRLDFLATDEAQWRLESEIKAGAFLSTAYVSDPQTRIACYRRLAEAPDRAAIDALRAEWRDRFGPLPVTAENALLCALIRLEAARRRITMVESRDGRIMLTQRKELLQAGGRFPRLTSPDPDSRLREILTHLDSIPAS